MSWAVLLLCFAPSAVWAQAKKRPPPLQPLLSAPDRDYASAAFSPDGRFLVAGASDALRVLDALDDAFPEVKLLAARGRIEALDFDAGADVLVSRSRGQDPVVWRAGLWAPVRYRIDDLDSGGLAARAARQEKLDPGTSCLVLPQRNRGLRLWNLEGLRSRDNTILQRDLADWNGLPLGRVTAVAWAETTLMAGDDQGWIARMPEARELMSRMEEADVVLGEITRVKEAGGRFRAHAGEVTVLALALKAERFVTAGSDGQVRLWDLNKVPPLARTARPEWEIPGLTADISPDGKLLAVAHPDGVGVYQAASGVGLAWNPVQGGRAVRLRFDAKGTRLAAILCRCAECRSRTLPRRLADHGGELIVWK